jgi:hypothetical protein
MTEYLTSSRRLPPDFDVDRHLARLDEDGFTIVEDYMSEDELARFREGLKPYMGMYRGRTRLKGSPPSASTRWSGAARSTRKLPRTTACLQFSTGCSRPTTC